MSPRLSALRHGATLRTGLLVALCASLLAVPQPAVGAGQSAGSTEPPFTQQVLFRGTPDQGYACFRIPAVVRTVKGTLLAFAEGRVNDCGDAGDIDIVLRRSSDGGRTWGPLKVVSSGGGDTHGNPQPVVDSRTGRILLAQTFNSGRADGKSCESPCDRTPHLQYSDDDGATWSPPRDLSAQLRPPDWNSWYATGPGHGLQLRHGRHAGRLVLGVNGETWRGGRTVRNHAALAISDDGGRNWRLGARDSRAHSPEGTFRQKPQELTLHERRDGSVLASARETQGTDLGHRSTAVARGGGEFFTSSFRAMPGLYTPQVQGSVLPLGGGTDRLLLSAPADPDRRRTMTVRSSYDEGATWEGVDRGRTVTTDWSGYSDMVRASGDRVGLLYEGGAADARDEIRFAAFTQDWLGPRRGPDPVTADRAPGAGDAAVLGGARQVTGHHGQALAFDGRDDAVRLPFRRGLPLGEADFTAGLWFRCTGGAGEQPLLWMGGVGEAQPQVRLTADGAGGRVTAAVTARRVPAPAATAQVSTAGAYNDGRWHRAELRRGDGQLRLEVDGESVTAPDVPGSVSVTSPFGVHLGQRVDSRAHLTGALDEVRVSAGGRSVLDLPLERAGPAR